MNLSRKLLQPLKVLVVTLVFSLICLSQNAIADTSIPVISRMFDVEINGGNFDVDVPDITIPQNFRVASAIVSLPDSETGMINKIVILGPDESLEFGCSNIKVQNGTDLITSCGGPAYLKAGETTYQASGSNFNSNTTVKLGINLAVTESNAF